MMIARRSASNCQNVRISTAGLVPPLDQVNTYGQNLAHHIGSGASDVLAEFVEGLQVSLVQSVTNDFDVHFIQILFGNAIHEEWSQWRIDQNGIVQFSWISSHVNGFHLLETTQWMTFWDQFRNWTLMQSSGDQQNDVVDHVAVSDEVQECRQWLDGMVAQVLEFNDQFLTQFVVDDRNGQW